ncbi:hypothetical protein, partial [Novosphingobium clariflavum]
ACNSMAWFYAAPWPTFAPPLTPMVRLHGNGRFERQLDGVWKMLDFRVDRFEVLDNRPIAEALAAVRAVRDNRLMDAEAYHDISRLRDQGDGDQ